MAQLPAAPSELDAVDLAWSLYRKANLPSPAPPRLLFRGAVPSNKLDFISKHYAIPVNTKIFLDYQRIEHPGHVTVSKFQPFRITINSAYEGWHDAEAAVLSHELCHVVMEVNGIRGRSTPENELFTDSFCIFLGAGLVSRFSESVDFYADGASTRRLGYLNEKQRAYAMSIFLKKSGIPISSDLIRQGWRRADLDGLEWASAQLKGREDLASSPPLRQGRIHFCPRCGTELEPAPEGRTLSCKNCGPSWTKGFLSYKRTI